MTPIVTRRMAVTTVAAASFWKRVTSLLRDEKRAVRCGRDPACDPAAILAPKGGSGRIAGSRARVLGGP
jgi:hypothetical protein